MGFDFDKIFIGEGEDRVYKKPKDLPKECLQAVQNAVTSDQKVVAKVHGNSISFQKPCDVTISFRIKMSYGEYCRLNDGE